MLSLLTSTLDASDEVLIMRPTTYFFIPGKYTNTSEQHNQDVPIKCINRNIFCDHITAAEAHIIPEL